MLSHWLEATENHAFAQKLRWILQDQYLEAVYHLYQQLNGKFFPEKGGRSMQYTFKATLVFDDCTAEGQRSKRKRSEGPSEARFVASSIGQGPQHQH